MLSRFAPPSWHAIMPSRTDTHYVQNMRCGHNPYSKRRRGEYAQEERRGNHEHVSIVCSFYSLPKTIEAPTRDTRYPSTGKAQYTNTVSIPREWTEGDTLARD